MKYCHACHKMTPGDPIFCNFCGSTYNLKFCSRLHPNPRHASVCSQCGSREMSAPQPRIPGMLGMSLWFVVRLPRFLLFIFAISSMYVALYVAATDRYAQQFLWLPFLMVAFAAVIWRITPHIVQRLARAGFRLLWHSLFSPRKQQGRRARNAGSSWR